MPFRSFLFSPGLSVADLKCPFCHLVMRAGRQSKQTIWLGILAGGIVSAVGAHWAYYVQGWNRGSSAGVVLAIAIIVGVALTCYSWIKDDYDANTNSARE